jgi:hypothetical protein
MEFVIISGVIHLEILNFVISGQTVSLIYMKCNLILIAFLKISHFTKELCMTKYTLYLYLKCVLETFLNVVNA